MKASAMLQAMEGARNSFCQLGERERKLGRSSILDQVPKGRGCHSEVVSVRTLGWLQEIQAIRVPLG